MNALPGLGNIEVFIKNMIIPDIVVYGKLSQMVGPLCNSWKKIL